MVSEVNMIITGDYNSHRARKQIGTHTTTKQNCSLKCTSIDICHGISKFVNVIFLKIVLQLTRPQISIREI